MNGWKIEVLGEDGNFIFLEDRSAPVTYLHLDSDQAKRHAHYLGADFISATNYILRAIVLRTASQIPLIRPSDPLRVSW